jgi:hypothetical protein
MYYITKPHTSHNYLILRVIRVMRTMLEQINQFYISNIFYIPVEHIIYTSSSHFYTEYSYRIMKYF